MDASLGAPRALRYGVCAGKHPLAVHSAGLQDVARDGWDNEEERRPLTGRALHPDPAAMGFHDAFDDGKTEPRTQALVVRHSPEAIEHARQMIALDPASRV